MSYIAESLNEILVFSTNIKNFEQLKRIQPIFNQQDEILKWSVDVQDVDRVLRIETKSLFSENKVIELLSKAGINCEVMTW